MIHFLNVAVWLFFGSTTIDSVLPEVMNGYSQLGQVLKPQHFTQSDMMNGKVLTKNVMFL